MSTLSRVVPAVGLTTHRCSWIKRINEGRFADVGAADNRHTDPGVLFNLIARFNLSEAISSSSAI